MTVTRGNPDLKSSDTVNYSNKLLESRKELKHDILVSDNLGTLLSLKEDGTGMVSIPSNLITRNVNDMSIRPYSKTEVVNDDVPVAPVRKLG